MKITFKNPLKVNDTDTIGTAIFKGAVTNYVKGVVTGAIGLGVLGYGIIKLNEIADSNEEEKDELKEDSNDELEEVEEAEDNDEVIEADRPLAKVIEFTKGS